MISRGPLHRQHIPHDSRDQALHQYTRVTTDMILALEHCREVLEKLEEQIRMMPPAFRSDPASERARHSLNLLREEVSAAIDNAHRLFKSVPNPIAI